MLLAFSLAFLITGLLGANDNAVMISGAILYLAYVIRQKNNGAN